MGFFLQALDLQDFLRSSPPSPQRAPVRPGKAARQRELPAFAQEFAMWVRRFLICAVLSLAIQAALAAPPRTFPANAQRGTVSGSIYPQVLINDQVQRLSPGAKIFSRQNLIIMPSTLLNKVYAVNYTVDKQGYIDRVWILTDEEIAQGSQ
jgi:hypothetical protein